MSANEKSAKKTGGLLILGEAKFLLERAVYFSFRERSYGGNNFQAILNGSLILIKLTAEEKKSLQSAMITRKYMDGKLLTNEVNGTAADQEVILTNARIVCIDNYGTAVGLTLEIGIVKDGDLVAEEDWNAAVVK